jgi:hypothetical protein
MVRMARGTVTRTTGITRTLIRLAIDFELDLLRGETFFTTTTLHALAPLTNASS